VSFECDGNTFRDKAEVVLLSNNKVGIMTVIREWDMMLKANSIDFFIVYNTRLHRSSEKMLTSIIIMKVIVWMNYG